MPTTRSSTTKRPTKGTSGDAPHAKRRKGSKKNQEAEEIDVEQEAEQQETKAPQEEAAANKPQAEEAAKNEQAPPAATTTTATPLTAPAAPAVDITPAASSDDKNAVVVYERGHIHFFFRSRLDVEKVSDLNDVARLYIVLQPTLDEYQSLGEKKNHPSRLLIIGRKSLPEFKESGGSHHGYWGFIDYIDEDYDKIMERLQVKQYQKETQQTAAEGGEKGAEAGAEKEKQQQKVEPSHAVGHGVYVLATHRGKHSHLVYVLELPDQPHEAQEMFHIGKEGSYILQLKNPLMSAREQKESGLPHINPEKKVLYSEELQEKAFGRGDYQLRWTSPYPIELLNATGAEVLIIPAKEDIVAELGKVGQDLEHLAKFEKLPNMGELIEELHKKQSKK